MAEGRDEHEESRAHSMVSVPAHILKATLSVRARLNREGTAASARSRSIGIVEGETRSHNGIDVIDFNTFEVLTREHINKYSQPTLIEHFITLSRAIFDLHRI